MTSIGEAIAIYDLIQERIGQICSQEQLAAEEEEAENEQQTHNMELYAHYEVLVDDGQAWHDGYQLQVTIDELNGSGDITGSYTRRAYEQIIIDQRQYRQTIMKMPHNEELGDQMKALQTAVRDLTTRMTKRCFSPRRWKAPQVLINMPPHPLHHGHHLPSSNCTCRASPENPTVEGFLSSIMEKETMLSDAEMICHLTGVMQSSDVQPVRWIPTRQWWKPWRNVTDRVPAPRQEDRDAGTNRLQSSEPEGASGFHPGPVPSVDTQQRTLSGSVSRCTSRAADG